MGIRHLYTFITKEVENGFFSIDLNNFVNNYKRKTTEQTPTIVIDLLMLHSHVYLNDHEKLLGGRFDVYNNRARYMFSQLKSLGVNLVFFVDGPTPEDKLETCLQRRNEAYKDGVQILHAIDDGLDISKELTDFKLPNLSTFFQNFIDIAKEFGEVHKSILNECDQEIVLLATQRNALAVITDDTDFLIFEGNWCHWSARCMNFEKLTTMEYNKSALRATLSLSWKQMTLLASLAGNDIVPYELVQNYHRRISYKRNKFYAIADEVRKMKSLPPQLSFCDKTKLINSVFYRRNQEQGMEVLQKSLNFYCLENLKFQYDNAVLERIAHEGKSFLYILLSKHSNIFASMYEDLMKREFSYYDIIKPILCRIMGVLLKNKPEENNTRQYYFKLDHSRNFELVELTPEYPLYEVPPLLDLLYHPHNENIELDQLRWNLLCFTVSKKLNFTVISKIPKNHLTTVLTLFCLFETKVITLDETDCILLSCDVSQEEQNFLNFNEVRIIDGRDARLAFLFPRIHNMIHNCIGIVGLRDYCALQTFDGLYFHNLRKKWKISDDKFEGKLLETMNSLRIYSSDFDLL